MEALPSSLSEYLRRLSLPAWLCTAEEPAILSPTHRRLCLCRGSSSHSCGMDSVDPWTRYPPVNVRCGVKGCLSHRFCYPKPRIWAVCFLMMWTTTRSSKAKANNTTIYLHSGQLFFSKEKRVALGGIWTHDTLQSRQSALFTELPGQLCRQGSNLQLNTMQQKAKASLENSVLCHWNLSLSVGADQSN